jgi:poly(hydroxyalkanoate) depolymerase family esterase
MADAVRLTRLGKVNEATALIQRLLQRKNRAAPETAGSAEIIDVKSIPAGTAPAESVGSACTQLSMGRTGLRETFRRLAERAKSAGLGAEGGLARRPAPDPYPEGASFIAASFSNEAGTRAYKLYIPSTLASERIPLIVMLHGCTQSPDDFAAGTRMNQLAEAHGFLVAYPAQSISANGHRCWNWFKPEDQRRDAGEPSIVAGITKQIMHDYPVDPSRVFIAGLSAGGAAAAIMGAAYPDVYASVGVHSGLPSGAAVDLPSALAAMHTGAPNGSGGSRDVPTIVFHGDGDSTVHPGNGDAVVAELTRSADGLRQTVRRGRVPNGHEYSATTYADRSGRTLCEQWTIHGAKHAWSGGSPSGSYTDPKGPDASKEMVRFFLAHRKD